MRTTVELDDELFRRAKAHAALSGVPLKEVIQNGVRLALAAKAPGKKKGLRLKFPLFDKKNGKKVHVPDDIVHRMEQWEDRQRYEASLRR